MCYPSANICISDQLTSRRNNIFDDRNRNAFFANPIDILETTTVVALPKELPHASSEKYRGCLVAPGVDNPDIPRTL